MEVESFSLDHTKVRAPFVRKCCVQSGPNGDKVTKFDLRFTQPNEAELESAGIHTLEHLMAGDLRDELEGIIDLSPMGCRTGFYMTVWGEPEVCDVIRALERALAKVAEVIEIPAKNPIQCGNYRLHDLALAKQYARQVLEKGIAERFLVE